MTMPYDKTTEASLIGALLIRPVKVLPRLKEKDVTEETFHVPECKLIYRVCCELGAQGAAIDMATVAARLKELDLLDKAGGVGVLERCIELCTTAEYADSYAETLKKYETRRKVIAISSDTIKSVEDTKLEPEDVLNQARAGLLALNIDSNKRFVGAGDIAEEKIEAYKQAEGKGFVGIPSVFPELNEKLGGYRKNLIAFGAYRSEGKSTFALQEAWFATTKGYRVVVFSVEDSADVAYSRIAGNIANVNCFDLERGKSDADSLRRFEKALQKISESDLRIMDDPMLTSEDVVVFVNQRSVQPGLDVAWLDHLQLLKPLIIPDTSRTITMGFHTSTLAAACKNKISLVCLSQFSRGAEQQNRKPRLSDFRDSGTIEQDARQCLIMYWNPETKNHELEVAKNYTGPAKDIIELKRIDHFQRFEQIDPYGWMANENN